MHPVVEKRNEEIRKEFKKLYGLFIDGEKYKKELYQKLGNKYHLDPESIRKIVSSN